MPQLKAFPTQDTAQRLSLTQGYKILAKLEEKWPRAITSALPPQQNTDFGKRKRLQIPRILRGIPGHFLCHDVNYVVIC